MKKIFTYLSVVALMAVACEGMYGPVETPTAPDQAGSVEIQIDTLGDETFAFTVTPAGEVSYYSYLVVEGPAQAVDSVSLYQCKYSGLAKGTCKAADVAEKTVVVEELAPNTPYTIYAVAGSPQGIPGSVVVKEVVTTDQVAIAIASFSTPNDSTVVLSFSEQVFLGEGQVTATYYASLPSVVAMGTVEAESVVVEGNTATVSFAGLPAGAYYAVSYTEGTFTDSADNKIKAFNSGYTAEAKKFSGVSSRKETANFDLDEAFPAEWAMFSDWQTAIFSVGVPGGQTLAVAGEGAVQAKYVTPGKTITIDMTLNQNYVFSTNAEGQSGVMMMCPEQPAFGTTVVFTFAEDAFQDIWGNSTNAAEYTSLCAYDYTLADVLGTYQYQVASAYDGSVTSGTFVIVASDNAEYGNVMFTTMWDSECQYNVYATFDTASGTLTIPSGQCYGVGSKYAYAFMTADGSGNPAMIDAVFNMPESGVLTFSAETYYVGDAALDPTSFAALGFFDLYYALEAVVVPEGTTSVATAAAPAKVLRPALK